MIHTLLALESSSNPPNPQRPSHILLSPSTIFQISEIRPQCPAFSFPTSSLSQAALSLLVPQDSSTISRISCPFAFWCIVVYMRYLTCPKTSNFSTCRRVWENGIFRILAICKSVYLSVFLVRDLRASRWVCFTTFLVFVFEVSLWVYSLMRSKNPPSSKIF